MAASTTAARPCNDVTCPTCQTHAAAGSRPALPRLSELPGSVLNPTPSAANWPQHRTALLASLNPHGALEAALADRIVLLFRQLEQVARFGIEALSPAGEPQMLKAIGEYEVQLDQSLHRAMEALRQLQGSRAPSPEPSVATEAGPRHDAPHALATGSPAPSPSSAAPSSSSFAASTSSSSSLAAILPPVSGSGRFPLCEPAVDWIWD